MFVHVFSSGAFGLMERVFYAAFIAWLYAFNIVFIQEGNRI